MYVITTHLQCVSPNQETLLFFQPNCFDKLGIGPDPKSKSVVVAVVEETQT